MPFKVVGWYDKEVILPWTEVYRVELYHSYDWSEGHIFVHDETGLFAWIQESGCSCNYFMDHVASEEEVSDVVWAPINLIVPDVIRYIESDNYGWGGSSNGPDWVVSEKARFFTWLKRVQ